MLAMLLQALYSIRSGCLLVKQIGCKLQFRLIVGLATKVTLWHDAVLSEKTDRSSP